MKKITGILLVITTGMLSLQCSESFLDRGPQDRPTPGNFFVNEISARNANSAIYNFWLRDARLHGRDLWIILDAMTDDAHWRTNRAESIQQEKWDIFPTHEPMVRYWTYVYRSINAANFAIEGIPNSTEPNFTNELRQQYVAEARFMRGFNYLFLVTLFGEIPLITNTLNTFEQFDQPKATKEAIYAAIIDDFTFARDNLPASWPAAYGGRPTRAAGATYLAQTYLFKEDYANAETAARNAITMAEGDGFQLIPDYESIFREETEDNAETLFKFVFVNNSPDMGTNTTVQINPNPLEQQFKNIYGEAWAYSLPQRSLYDAYEEDDPRRGYTIWAPGDFFDFYQSAPATITHKGFDVDGTPITYQQDYEPGDPILWHHYWALETGMGTKKMATPLTNLANVRWSGKDLPMMRMAELYLILAEALAEQGNAEALDWVNVVRARPSVKNPMNLPPRTLGDGRPGDNLVDIVRHERRVELAMESKRLFDIMRWKNLGEIFQGTNVKRHFYWEFLNDNTEPKGIPSALYDQPLIELPKHYYFPIPQVEIDINPLINDNNPGY